MSQATLNVLMDEKLKRQFDSLCFDFWMTASAVINVFARAAVREQRIPFEVKPAQEITREKAAQVFHALRAEAKKNGVQGMSLEEINAEISAARAGK